MPKSKTSLNDLLYEIRRIAEHREILTDEKIRAIYQTLEKDLKSFVAENYEDYADADGRLYTAYLDSQNQRAKFMQEIVDNFDGVAPSIKAQITQLIDYTYEKSYAGMLTAFKKAEKAGKFEEATKDIAVNPNVLKSAVNNNISKLTLPQVMEKHRAEIIYQIQQELNIGLMQGDRYETMAKRISNRLGVSESKAKNIVRTESHRNVESGFMDCAEHLQDGLDGSDLIYAATWHTMGDERVRPQQRIKGKKGKWKTTFNKSGANHMKMEGVTVKAGEFFNLGNGVKAKAPGKSGVAAHDCNCRCYLEYNLMTVEEFAKATGKKIETVVKKSAQTKNVELKVSDYPDEFSNIDASKQLLNKWDEYRKQFVGNGVDVSTINVENNKMFQTVDLKKLGNKNAQTVLNTVNSLEDRFYSPLNKIVTMDKTETAMNSVFATTTHNWGAGACEIRINPVKTSENNINRVFELGEKGYSIKIPKGKEMEYLVTHEFGHSILNVGETLPLKSKNFVQVNFDNVKKARKEINTVFDDYISNVEKYKNEYDTIRKPIEEKMLFGTGDITTEERNLIANAHKKYKGAMISEYSMANVDEFVAEAFADVEIGEKPSEYSKKVYDILIKYFGK